MANITTPATSKELVGRMRSAWVPFRLGAESIGVDALDEATSAGWTYKQMLAHVAAWHELTARRLRRYRERGETGLPSAEETVEIFDALGLREGTREAVLRQWSADAFNAAVAEAAAGRTADSVLTELDESFGRVVAAVEPLTDAEVAAHVEDGRTFVEAVLEGNTFGHYDEHRDELLAAVPRTPAEVASRMRAGWQRFRGAVAKIGLTPLGERTHVGWTIKGLLGHLTNWLEVMPTELPLRLEGRRGPPRDGNAENARASAEASARTAHEVVERLDAAYRGARAALLALPRERPLDPMVVGLVAAWSYANFRLHQKELDPFVPRTAQALAGRMEAAWRPFRDAVRERGRAGLAEPTPTGWTYKDLVAHVIGWLQQAAKELREGAYVTWDTASIDAFNARSVEARRLVGPEALVDELDTSYRAVLTAVRALDDAQVEDNKVFGPAAFCTHLHWEEHFHELRVNV